jgi:peptide/nickel transport system substrate-binding protein
MLAALVEAGKLPPVDERLPAEPLVQPVVEEIGQYGGIWHHANVSVGVMPYYSFEGLLNFSIDGNSVVPFLAKGWEVNEEGNEFTFFLREGTKWSDGEPFTADDLVFWYEDIVLNDELSPTKPNWLKTKGELGRLEKVDDYTVKFVFAHPYGTFLEWVANQSWGMLHPRHYLEQFHPKYTDPDELAAAADAAGFDSWFQYFGNRNNREANPDRPTLGPWKLMNDPEANPRIYERNPYYFSVDEAGQQLPYIDGHQIEIVTSTEVLNFMAIAGELDYQDRHTNIMNFPLFIEGQEQGGYRVIQWPSSGGCDAGLMINQNAGQQDGASEHQKVVGDLLRTVEFRQALSIAMDRDEIWNSAFLGLGEPRQMAPVRESKYYEEGMEKVWIEYDPDRANQMLDELGLTERDADGFRLGPDGQAIDIFIATVDQFGPWPDTGELARDYWNRIGIKASTGIEERSLHYTRMQAGEHQVAVWETGGNGHVLIYPYWTCPYSSVSRIGPLSGIWYSTGGQQGIEPEGDFRRVLDVLDEATVEPDEATRDELAREIFRINLANLWTIGTVGATPMSKGIVIVKNNFRNVPEYPIGNEDAVHSPANVVPAQYFMRQS